MSTTALIHLDYSNRKAGFTAEALALKEKALQTGALVGKVTNAQHQEAAVLAQKELKNIISLAEKARKEAKEPFLQTGRDIDEAHRAYIAEVNEEMARISKLVGAFQQLEAARVASELKAQNEKLTALEREREKQMADCKTDEERDAVVEHFNHKAAAASAPVEATRTEGQRVATDWEVTVTDIHTLYRFHPNCVKLDARLSEIKELLKCGITPKGVKAVPIVKAGVRSVTSRPIEV